MFLCKQSQTMGGLPCLLKLPVALDAEPVTLSIARYNAPETFIPYARIIPSALT